MTHKKKDCLEVNNVNISFKMITVKLFIILTLQCKARKSIIMYVNFNFPIPF